MTFSTKLAYVIVSPGNTNDIVYVVIHLQWLVQFIIYLEKYSEAIIQWNILYCLLTREGKSKETMFSQSRRNEEWKPFFKYIIGLVMPS